MRGTCDSASRHSDQSAFWQRHRPRRYAGGRAYQPPAHATPLGRPRRPGAHDGHVLTASFGITALCRRDSEPLHDFEETLLANLKFVGKVDYRDAILVHVHCPWVRITLCRSAAGGRLRPTVRCNGMLCASSLSAGPLLHDFPKS